MNQYILSLIDHEALLALLYVVLGALPITAAAVWKYVSFHYRERHDANEHRIKVLQERLAHLCHEQPINASESWSRASREIKAMEEIFIKRVSLQLEERDKKFGADINGLKKQIIEMEFILEMLEAGIKVFMSNQDKAIAYSAMVENGRDPNDRDVLAFLADGDLRGKVGIVKEAQLYVSQQELLHSHAKT